jgi:hypothetical protein
VSDEVLVSIAAALASKAAASILEFVRRKFARRPEATAVLDAADGAAADSAEVLTLSEELAAAERMDPEFGSELRAMWQAESVVQNADRGGVTNQVGGSVSGKVVQARDVQGGISF